MLQIRSNTFETNSSSTHSIVICTKKQFEDWRNGLCKFNPYTRTFITFDSKQMEEYRNRAIENYKQNKDPDPYCINWNDLPSEQQEKYIQSYVKYLMDNDSDYSEMTYDQYLNHYEESCEYTYQFYTTEHGDEICAFGKGGYCG